MATLNLLNLKKNPPQKETGNDGEGRTSQATNASEVSGGTQGSQPTSPEADDKVAATSGGVPELSSDSQRGAADEAAPEAQAAEDNDSPAPVPAAKLGGLKLGGLSGLKLNKPVTTPKAPPLSSSESSPVGDLAALSQDTSTGIPGPSFADEIPATAPERELPADMTEEMQGFVKSLDGIYSVMDDPELFAQMIRNIMMELQENPQYKKLLADDDVAAMIRGMRESMGLARMRKVEAKTKRTGTGTSAKGKKNNAKNDEVLDTLGDLAASMGVTFD